MPCIALVSDGIPVWQVRALIANNADLLERYDRSLLESYVEVSKPHCLWLREPQLLLLRTLPAMRIKYRTSTL